MASEMGLVGVVGQTLRALKKGRFNAVFVRNRKEALQCVLDQIPNGASVGAGDSVTLKEIGIFEELKRRNFTVYWPFDEGVPRERAERCCKKSFIGRCVLVEL